MFNNDVKIKKITTSKLKLVPISLENNAGGREIEILDILVPIYINLFIDNPSLYNIIEIYI